MENRKEDSDWIKCIGDNYGSSKENRPISVEFYLFIKLKAFAKIYHLHECKTTLSSDDMIKSTSSGTSRIWAPLSSWSMIKMETEMKTLSSQQRLISVTITE